MYSRATTSTMYGTLLGSLQKNLTNIQDLQRQMATMNKYANLADNPSAIARSLGIQSSLNANEKYQETGKNAISMLKYSEGALNNILGAAETVRDLIIQAGNSSLSSNELQDIADQIEAEKKIILDSLNTKIAGQYIFGGTDTSTPPFAADADGNIVYQGSDERIKYALGENLTGDVSFAGSQIIPTDESTYFICSHYVPLDWEWTGREEKVQITVGDRTLAVFIPEQWVDEIASAKTGSTDYNGFRDPGEVTGISLDDLATLVNRSLEEQGADMLVTATVQKNLATNEQQMIIKSNTGEKVGITGWTDTDYMPVAQSLAGIQFEKTGTTADGDVEVQLPDWNSNILGGSVEPDLSKLAGKTLTINSNGNSTTYTFTSADEGSLDTLVANLNSTLKSGKTGVTAGVQNGRLVLTSEAGNSIRIDSASTAASQLFGTATVSEGAKYSGVMGTSSVLNWRDDSLGKGIRINIDGDSNDYDFEFSGMKSVSDLVDAINSKLPSGAGDVPVASLVSGRLVLQSSKGQITVQDLDTTKPGGTQQLFGSAGPVAGSTSSLSIQVGDAQAVKVYINDDDDLNDVAEKINAIEGVYARTSADGDQLVVVARRTGTLSSDSLAVDAAQETLHYPSLRIEGTGGAMALFDFEFISDTETGRQTGIAASKLETRAVDHSHMDVFDVLGMETAMKSVEVPTGENALTIEADKPLHWRIMSGGHTADITLREEGTYSLSDIAERLKSAGAGWLEVTVDVVKPEANAIDGDATETGSTSYNSEQETQRLVIRGYNGEQVLFLDMNEQHYADELGLSTALRAEPETGMKCVNFPQAPCVDDNMGVKVRVQMNCGMSYDVTLSEKAVTDPKTGFVDRAKVMQEIVNQVNAQEGETIMGFTAAVDMNGAKLDERASIYFLSGESFTVVDLPFSDPEWSDYSGGIAAQMGIHGGVTANMQMTDIPKKDYETLDVNGTIEFSSLGHSVKIDVSKDDTIKSVMDRLRSQAGDWLYVNYYDTHMGQMDDEGLGGRNAGDYPIIAISAVDGSAVNVLDIKNGEDDEGNAVQIARDIFGLSTGIQGTESFFDGSGELDTSKMWEEGETPGSVFSITVAGYTHNIDMTAMRDVNGNGKLDAADLAETINARMQDYDVQAKLSDDGKLLVWSPRGYSISVGVYEVDANGSTTDENGDFIKDRTDEFLGTAKTETYYRGGYELDEAASTRTSPGIHNQNATIRSGANTTKQNAFGMLDDVIATVKSGNRSDLENKMLPRINNFINNILGVLSSNGAMQNRYEANISRLTTENAVMTDDYDELVKIDPAEVVSSLMMANYVYEANLAIIARLIQPSLLDFLS